MCGIAGQMAIKYDHNFDESELKQMLTLLHHRGPEGTGEYIDNDIMFGQSRLSFIDLENGWQPLYNENKDLVMCCNGEVYNYIEIRDELQAKGHAFRTKSDCEMIPHLYQEYGLDFPNKINGMFAISIWDKRTKKLILCRDRVGRCPLYYTVQNSKVYFASEIKSIIACKRIVRNPNYEALDSVMTFNYIPDEKTAFEGIFKVEPGQMLIFDKMGNIEKRYYWECKSNNTFNPDISYEDAVSNIEELLYDAVRLRLRSDVPVGSFLSGGIDSSIVLAYAADFNRRIKTFSIGFSEEKYNELPYARVVANLFDADHNENIVNPDFFSLLPVTIWYNDEPHGDVSFLPMYVLSETTTKHVKTVLTGDGSDELFGGYTKYLDFLKRVPETYMDFYESASVFCRDFKCNLYTDEFLKITESYKPLNYIEKLLKRVGMNPVCLKNEDILNPLLYLETRILLDGNNLIKTDRMGMGNSIEGRMPFLDYRLVEYAMQLPSSFKISDGVTKKIIKSVAVKRLPTDVVYRNKQMFTVPIGEWFKSSLKNDAYRILLDKRTLERGIFRRNVVKQMLDEHVSGKNNYTRQLRLLIIIELWFRIFIDDLYLQAPKLDDLMA